MYCNKCGKEIENGVLCEECAVIEMPCAEASDEAPVKEAEVTDPVETIAFSCKQNTNPLPEPQNRMFGFGKALASTILSIVGFIFVYIAMILSLVEPGAGLPLIFLSMPLLIIPLIFGILSIKVFMERKATCAKPIPTLILGIVGLSTAVFAAFFQFLAFLISISGF